MRARGRPVAGLLVFAIIAGACSVAPPPGTPAPAGTLAPGEGLTPYLFPSPPPADVSNAPASIDVETAGATTAWIGPRGGTLTATGVDGTTYVLAFPEFAVAEPTAITMAPVGTVDGLALSGGLAGAVWLAPSGLALTIPATLRINPTQAPPEGMRLAGFDIAGDASMGLLPLNEDEAGIDVMVFHFSAAGAGWGTTADLRTLGSVAPTGRVAGLMSHFLAYDVPWSATDQAAAFGLLLALWDNLLRPSLEEVGSDAELRMALGDWRQFVFVLNLLAKAGDVDAALALGLEAGQLPGLFVTLQAPYLQGRSLIGARIGEAIAGNRSLCTDSHDLGALANMWYWAGIGQRFVPDGDDWMSTAEGCAGLVISVANLPTILAEGASDSVRLQFALEFDDGSQVPADVDATINAGGFEFIPDGGTQLSRPVAAETLLTVGIAAVAPAPFTLTANLCWVLNGTPRPLCGQDSRQFGTPATAPPASIPASPSGPVTGLLGCYAGTYFRQSGEPFPLSGPGGPVCIRDGSQIPQLGTPTLALSFSHAYMHGSGPSCLYDLGIGPQGGAFGPVSPFFCGAGIAVDAGYRIQGQAGAGGISFTVVWHSPEGQVFDWGSFELEPPPF